MKRIILFSLVCFGIKNQAHAQKLVVNATPPGVTFETVTAAINEITLDKAIKIYPNPAVNEITITSTEGYEIHSCDIFIYDERGKLVLIQKDQSLKEKSLKVNVQDLPAGLYTMVLKTPNNKAAINSKFIISK